MMVTTTTVWNPARRRIFAHSSTVEPVVRTSSMRTAPELRWASIFFPWRLMTNAL